MFVQLAYPWQGHQTDEVLEVGEATGRRLIKDGNARPAPEIKKAKPQPRKRSTRAPLAEVPTSPETPADAGPESEGD